MSDIPNSAEAIIFNGLLEAMKSVWLEHWTPVSETLLTERWPTGPRPRLRPLEALNSGPMWSIRRHCPTYSQAAAILRRCYLRANSTHHDWYFVRCWHVDKGVASNFGYLCRPR